MALIKCSDCGRDVSDRAISCLSCGNPIRKPASLGPKDVAKEIHQTYSNIIKKISEDINSAKKSEIKEYRETIRNLILTSAAVAAFSLPLLSDSEILKPPLILGIILLLTDIVISYVHLKIGWTSAFKKFIESEEILLAPMIEITKFAVEVLRGTKIINDLIDKDEKFREIGGEYDRMSEYISNASTESKKLNYADNAIIVLFVLALICLIYSIIGKSFGEFLFVHF